MPRRHERVMLRRSTGVGFGAAIQPYRHQCAHTHARQSWHGALGPHAASCWHQCNQPKARCLCGAGVAQRTLRCTRHTRSPCAQVASALLGASVPVGHCAARLLLFVGGPCTEGNGKVVSRELTEEIRSHKVRGRAGGWVAGSCVLRCADVTRRCRSGACGSGDTICPTKHALQSLACACKHRGSGALCHADWPCIPVRGRAASSDELMMPVRACPCVPACWQSSLVANERCLPCPALP
jgi:hypothetical protein